MEQDRKIPRCVHCRTPEGPDVKLIPASLQPGSTLRQCADGKGCVARRDEMSAAVPAAWGTAR